MDKIDENITIGIELEFVSYYINELEHLKENIPVKRWKVSDDASVKIPGVSNGKEIQSPILRYTEKDIIEIKKICDFLESKKFFTNSTCGGHIHLGSDYIETIDEYLTLVTLYNKVERIMYLITNKKDTIIRHGVTKYAKSNKELYKNIQNFRLALGNFIYEDDYNLKRFSKTIQNMYLANYDDRYLGLNLQNFKGLYKPSTIEFRLANGEINFNELFINITLYCRLLMTVKEINRNSEKRQKYEDLLELDDKLQVDILIKFLELIEIDRKPYIERYLVNSKKRDNNYTLERLERGKRL